MEMEGGVYEMKKRKLLLFSRKFFPFPIQRLKKKLVAAQMQRYREKKVPSSCKHWNSRGREIGALFLGVKQRLPSMQEYTKIVLRLASFKGGT